MRKPAYLASFDSATAMVRALSAYLHGKDFPQLGMTPGAIQPLLEPVGLAVNSLPVPLRELIYTKASANEGIETERAPYVQAEEMARWVASVYPKRQYPAVMVGSSNGAAVHLGAALGIPWLPQTLLVLLKANPGYVDEPKQALAAAQEAGFAVLTANSELQLHHMHDPNQDRLTSRGATYFRVKRLRLGHAYTRFLEERLMPGGTIFLLDCGLTWPATHVTGRYLFQFGAYGGLEPDDYYQGGPRVEAYLKRYGVPRHRWDAPPPDGQYPEAEWGFAPELGSDVERLARDRGYTVRRIAFQEPEDLSPLVADLYRSWYRRRRMKANRLLAESFVLMEPWWTLRTGSVPFWLVFGVERSARALERYLLEAGSLDELFLMLFSHGTESAGLAPIERWRSILQTEGIRQGEFVGVDSDAYPRDFASFVRYHTDVPRRIPARYPLSAPLTLQEFDEFLERADGDYPVSIVEEG